MNPFTMRRVAATSRSALTFTMLAAPGPASAVETDDAAIAARICQPGVSPHDSMSSEARTWGDLYAYSIDDDQDGAPESFCTFAVINTEKGSTLAGAYTLTVGPTTVQGVVTGDGVVTTPVISTAGQAPSAAVHAAGTETTVTTRKATTAQKKAAKKALAKATKKAKASYRKGSHSAKAKRALARKIAHAKKKYRKAVTGTTVTKTRAFGIDVDLPLEDLL